MEKTARLYGLYERQGRRWVRVPNTGAYRKRTAVAVFQSMLLAAALCEFAPERSLRPVPRVCGLCGGEAKKCDCRAPLVNDG